MSSSILSFIEEMRKLTKYTFVYRIDYWAFDHSPDIKPKHSICSILPGFSMEGKETEEELIEAIPLMKKLVVQSLEILKTQKRLNTILIK